MKVICYLVVQGKKPRYGDRDLREVGSLRLTRKKPSTAADEIAVRLEVEVPDALFIKPTLLVSAKLPEGATMESEISAEVAENISDVIREQTGLSVVIHAAGDE